MSRESANQAMGIRHGGRLQIAGIALVIFSTLCIAIVPAFAKLAYDGGSNTFSIITGRGIVSVLMAFPLLLLLRQPIRIGRRPLAICTANGFVYAVMLYCYIGAVQYLAVNLVILIYFIHPLMVGFIVAGLGYQRLTRWAYFALTGALVGLGLAIGFSGEGLNLAGVGLAVTAMVTAAITIIANGRAMQYTSGLTVAFYMLASAAATLLILFPFFGTMALPTTASGWLGLLGVAIGATTGTIAFYCGMAWIGAVRAAMISNLEPVLGVIFAMTIVGESLTLIQAAGIALVLSSIIAMEIWGKPK